MLLCVFAGRRLIVLVARSRVVCSLSPHSLGLTVVDLQASHTACDSRSVTVLHMNLSLVSIPVCCCPESADSLTLLSSHVVER